MSGVLADTSIWIAHFRRPDAKLRALRHGVIASTEEVLALIDQEGIEDSGCGAVDASLLASVLLTPGARLWTADKALGRLAQRLGVGFKAS